MFIRGTRSTSLYSRLQHQTCSHPRCLEPTASVVSLNVTTSSPRLLIPDEPCAVFTSAAVPVNVVTVFAFTAPDVFPSKVFRTEAAVSYHSTYHFITVYIATPWRLKHCSRRQHAVNVVTVAASIAPVVAVSVQIYIAKLKYRSTLPLRHQGCNTRRAIRCVHVAAMPSASSRVFAAQYQTYSHRGV